MREFEVRAMHEADARRMSLILRQFEFMKTRFDAYETVLSSRKAMFRALWNPAWLRRAVDAVQATYLNMIDEQRKAAAEKVKEEASKPKLTIVGANGLKHG